MSSKNKSQFIEKPFPALVGYWNKDLINVQANEAYSLFFGKTPGEIKGAHVKDFLGAEMFALNLPYIEKALQGEFQSFERVIPVAEGQKHTIVQYLPDKQHGEVRGFFAVVTDVTELKIIQEKLISAQNTAEEARQKAETLATGLDQLAVVTITDLAGAIIYANDKFLEVSGYTQEELVGKTHRVVKSGVHGRDFYKNLWETILAGRIWKSEVCNRSKDGSLFWVDCAIVPVYNEKGEIHQFLSIRYNISDRKKAEKNLLQSAKMASLGEMASGLAHEINNPLTVLRGVIGNCRMTARDSNLDRNVLLHEIEKAMNTTNRISDIIRGLRTFSRDSEEDPFTLTTIDRLIDDSLALCSEKLKNQGIELRYRRAPSVNLECRPSQMIQVFLNLINNSRDAIESLDEKWIQLDVELTPDNVVFSVTDSGLMMTDELHEKVFVPFFTTKKVGRGVGLGLSITKGIIEKHNGTIEIDKKSVHTKFVFEIPRRQSPTGKPRPAQ